MEWKNIFINTEFRANIPYRTKSIQLGHMEHKEACELIQQI